MPIGSCPRLLILALSLPEISHALGLGALRVESSLNEPLSAQVDIIGATPDELQAIRASVASPELFNRFNVERPAFLSSATIMVGTGATGQPVLNIQSTDAFTEPMVEFLIDLRSDREQLVRDYTVMLDPASVTPIISATTTALSDETAALLVRMPPVDIPDAGALIRIPSAAEIDAFGGGDVKAKPLAQKSTRRHAHRSAQRRVAAPPGADLSAVLSAMNSLHGQVQFLQQTLGDTSRQLASANARIGDLERGGMPHAVVTGQAMAVRDKAHSSYFSVRGMLAGLALLAGALAFAWRRLLAAPARRPISAEEPTVEAPILDPATVEMAQVADSDVDTVEMRSPADADEPDTVVAEILETQASDATGTALDYNLSDLDGHAHHVEMPDTLRDPAAMMERRKNVVDTLMAALQRDPTRSDLRMKLLETLHTAAATNLRIFKDVVRDVVRHPERLNADEWEQVMAMGRQIAADDAMFADQGSGENIADCA